MKTLSSDEMKDFFTTLFTDCEDALIFLNASGQVLSVNPMAEKIFDQDQAELCEKNILEYHKEHPITVLESFKTLSSSQDVTLEKQKFKNYYLTWQLKKVAFSTSDDHGVILVGKNITQNPCELYMKTIMDNLLSRIPLSIFYKDMDGKYRFCNQFNLQMAGLDSYEDIIGKTDYDMPWKDVAKITEEIDKEICRTQTPRSLEEQGTLGDGSTGCYWSNKFPLYDEQGAVSGLFGIAIDITKYKDKMQRNINVEKVTKLD